MTAGQRSGAREQVTRLLALVPYLQAREVSLREAAGDFGVTPAQVVRDLRVLWMCGLPGLGPGDLIDIDFEAFEDDPDGIVRLDNADYLDRPLTLGRTEAAALTVALRALREAAAQETAAIIDGALAKLEAAAELGDTPVALQVAPPDTELLRTTARLREAVAADRQVRLEYYVPTRDEVTERIVDPIGVTRHGGHEYLDAWCHTAEGQRLFRLDRVKAARVLDTPRERRDVEPRDLAAGLFESSPRDTLVVVDLSASMAWFADHYPVVERTALPDDGLRVALRVADERWLVRLALRFAPGLRVRRPVRLRREVAQVADRALAAYGSGPSGVG